MSVERSATLILINPEARFLMRFQEEIQNRKARISGRFSDEFNELLRGSEEKLLELIETDDGQKNFNAIFEKSKSLGIDEKKVYEAFLEGMKNNIKAGYKLRVFDTETDKQPLMSELISSYTLSFRLVLNSFERERLMGRTESPTFILGVAKKLYFLRPDIYSKLRIKYQDDEFISDGMIKRFIIHNAKDPELAIEKAKKVGLELKTKYKNDWFVDNEMIKRFIALEKNPELAIERARAEFFRLRDKYKDDEIIDIWMIKYFIVNNSKNPEEAVEIVKDLFLVLKWDYPNRTNSEIIKAVVYHQSSYRKYLDSLN